jgi:protein SCO1/2
MIICLHELRVSLVLAILVGPLAGMVDAQTTLPAMLQNVGIDQNIGAQISKDLVFRDETGQQVKLGDYFGNRPIVLALVYYRCPMLCTMVLNELVRTLNAMPTAAGKDFDILTVSFDPKETPDLAAAKKRQYLAEYPKASAAGGWHFLTGDEESIRALTSTAGFRYVYDPKTQQYIHASGLMVLTPDGTISRYFYGIDYAPRDLRLALDEAAGRRLSSPTEKILLYCFHYDPSTGRYSLMVTRIIRVGAVLTLLALSSFMVIHLRREKHRKLVSQ